MNMEMTYEEYAQFVYRFLLSLCHDASLAEELTQETFYKAMVSQGNFDGTCKVSTWLCQIARHLWYQHLDRQHRHPSQELKEDRALSTISAEDEYLVKESEDLYRKQILLLPEVAKEVFLLRTDGDFSFKQIGETLGKTENWARVTYYRAKQRIIKEVGK